MTVRMESLHCVCSRCRRYMTYAANQAGSPAVCPGCSRIITLPCSHLPEAPSASKPTLPPESFNSTGENSWRTLDCTFVRGIAILRSRVANLCTEQGSAFRREFDEAIAEVANSRVVLNLSGLLYFPGWFISEVVMARKRIDELKLCCLTDQVVQVFRVCNLHMIFDIYDTEADALRSLDKATA